MLQRGAILVLGSMWDGVAALVPAANTPYHAMLSAFPIRLLPHHLPIAHGSSVARRDVILNTAPYCPPLVILTNGKNLRTKRLFGSEHLLLR
jgi:hypothetical protein